MGGWLGSGGKLILTWVGAEEPLLIPCPLGPPQGGQGSSSSRAVHSLQRPRYTELKAVMEQIPDIQRDSLEQFDSKLLNPSLQKVADKRRKDHFKRLIAGCIGVGDTCFISCLYAGWSAGLPLLCTPPTPHPCQLPARRLLQHILSVCSVSSTWRCSGVGSTD